MRAIVCTASVGCAPTLVSPDNINASAPSRTAFATSETSARVGLDAPIIVSSIWVATMTGFAFRRARAIARFCTSGTSSSGISTPRSPRAIMKPSKASMISSSRSTAWGFSILAMTGTRRPSSSMILATSAKSSADRTNDNAIMSAPIRKPHRRSSRSFSLIAGTDKAAPGTLIPLWSEIVPPSITVVRTRGPSTATTSRQTRPSSIRIRKPGWTSPGNPAYVVDASTLLPGTSSVVIVNSAPATNVTGPLASRPSRIFGPWRSTMMPTARPLASDAERTSW